MNSFRNTTGSKKIKSPESIHWISFQEAIKLNAKEPRKIYIDVYTNWCGWCKRMDQTSFEDPKIIQEMSSDYYAVKLNAETKDSITFDKHTFRYMPEYKANELALALLHGQMAYPTTVILDQDEKILSRIPGYLEPNALQEILGYFGKNNHLKFTWNQYEKSLGHDTLARKK
jgi:thioredoxin-related protein